MARIIYRNVISGAKLNEYVTELEYDLVDGFQKDTYIKVEAERICIAGDKVQKFANELQSLIDKYRI